MHAILYLSYRPEPSGEATCESLKGRYDLDNVFYRGYLALKSGYGLGHVEYPPTP